MKQYLDLLKQVREKGTVKPPARSNMPGTTSLFGAQYQHDLSEGFPLLTTKKVSFNNVLIELLWFMTGDINIKYLIRNKCNIWNEDAYNYYVKIASKNLGEDANKIYKDNGDGTLRMFLFDEFVDIVKNNNLFTLERNYSWDNRLKGGSDCYVLGDCGEQYGRLWRHWRRTKWTENKNGEESLYVDQLQELIDGLLKNPESRRHIITAWNPATLNDMALNACHALIQFNCRPLSTNERIDLFLDKYKDDNALRDEEHKLEVLNDYQIPKYHLDCQLYQRSADSVLGVPYNLASYSLMTHFLAKICNMIPGKFIHTFGDVHIYDNHKEAVEEQLRREPIELPTIEIASYIAVEYPWGLDRLLNKMRDPDCPPFKIINYHPSPAIKAELSTGLKK